MKFLASALKVVTALFAVNFVAIMVVAAVLAGQGVLTRERLAAAVEALRGVPESTASRPATTTAPAEPPPPISLAERTRAVALVRAELAREIAEAHQRAEMVARERERLESERAAFEKERKAFLESTRPMIDARRRAGLRQLVKTLSALKAPRIKALTENLPDAELAEVLVGLEPRLRGKVINEFKTPEEVERMRKVMDLIRLGKVARGQPGTGKKSAT